MTKLARARLENRTDLNCDPWVKVVFPKTSFLQHDEVMNFHTDNGGNMLAVRCEDIGIERGTLYRIRAPLGPGQRVDGTLGPSNGDTDFTLGNWVFEPTLSVEENIKILIPGATVVVKGTPYTFKFDPSQIELVSSSKAHQTFKIQQRIGDSGFCFVCFLTVESLSDIVECDIAIPWTDRNNPSLDLGDIDAIAIHSGEYFASSFGQRNGFWQPVYNSVTKQWDTLLTGKWTMMDGQAIWAHGHLLCGPQGQVPDPAEGTNEDDEATIREYNRVQNLYAFAYDPPDNGVCLGWDGYWMGGLNVPRMSVPYDYSDARSRFEAMLATPAAEGYAQQRHRGLSKTPGQTGSQQGFGSCKGTEAVMSGEPKWIQEGLHAAEAHFMRGYIHLEDDASDMTYANHPDRITWSMWTHFRVRPPDTYGKQGGTWGERWAGKGWVGEDDQHRGGRNMCATYMLTGNPMLMWFINHRLQNDLQSQAGRMGAPRAVGRRFGDYADLITICPHPIYQGVEEISERLLRNVENLWRGGQHGNPVKFLSYNPGDQRMGVFGTDGKVLPAVSIWEHGLFAVGCYNLYKATGDIRYLHILKPVCSSIVNHATFYQNGRWYICDTMWYPLGDDEGRPITELGVKMALESPQVNAVPGAGTDKWALNAVLIACEILEDGPTKDRARMVRDTYTGGVEARDINTAEWYACVQSVLN